MSSTRKVVLSTIGAVIVAPFLVASGFYLFSWTLPSKGMWVVFLAVVSFLVKMSIQAGNDAMYFTKQGYDFCIIALGTAITTGGTEFLNKMPDGYRLGGWALLLLAAVSATSMLGRLVRKFQKQLLDYAVGTAAGVTGASPPKEGLDGFLSFFCGITLFVVNLSLLITKKV